MSFPTPQGPRLDDNARSPTARGEGERFLDLYGRYRDVVRQELEAAGLGGEAAERLVGAVFSRLATLVKSETPADPVVEIIRNLARQVSAAPQRPSPDTAPLREGPSSSVGFRYVSGG